MMAAHKTWVPVPAPAVAEIEAGYAKGELVADMARRLGLTGGTVDSVIARAVRAGRLQRRKPRATIQRAAEAPPLPPTPETPRTCLGCGKVFLSVEPPKLHRLCASCGKCA